MSVTLVVLLSLAILIVGFLVGWLVGGLGATLSGMALLALPILVIGFLIGWLVEWIIDNQYRRMRELARARPVPGAADAAAAPDTLTGSEVSQLAQTLKEILEEREQEVDTLRADLQDQESRYDQLETEFGRYAATHPDDLTAVKGIGRIYQWKLRDAGYSTYAQLAGANADEIREILGVQGWQKVDPQSWIDQAKVMGRRD